MVKVSTSAMSERSLNFPFFSKECQMWANWNPNPYKRNYALRKYYIDLYFHHMKTVAGSWTLTLHRTSVISLVHIMIMIHIIRFSFGSKRLTYATWTYTRPSWLYEITNFSTLIFIEPYYGQSEPVTNFYKILNKCVNQAYLGKPFDKI